MRYAGSKIGDYALFEERARRLLERLRWGGRVKCPFADETMRRADGTKRCALEDPRPRHEFWIRGRRPGLLRCPWCRRDFSVTVGTALAYTQELRAVVGVTRALCLKSGAFRTEKLALELGVTRSCVWRLSRRVSTMVGHKRVRISDGRSEFTFKRNGILQQLLSSPNSRKVAK